MQPANLLIHVVDEDSIKVLKLYNSESHELHVYLLASRKNWGDAKTATTHGQQLAQQHGLTFKHDRDIDEESYQESMLLD